MTSWIPTNEMAAAHIGQGCCVDQIVRSVVSQSVANSASAFISA